MSNCFYYIKIRRNLLSAGFFFLHFYAFSPPRIIFQFNQGFHPLAPTRSKPLDPFMTRRQQVEQWLLFDKSQVFEFNCIAVNSLKRASPSRTIVQEGLSSFTIDSIQTDHYRYLVITSSLLCPSS